MPIARSSDGTSIAFVTAGAGEPVLFIQGAGVPASGWRPQLESLSAHFTCAAFDHRGIGGSDAVTRGFSIEAMAEDALAVMNELGWTSAHVVGHSVGGLVAQALALGHRSRVKSLALLCTFVDGRQPGRLSPWIVWTGMRTYVGTRRMRRHAFLEILLADDERRERDLDAFALEMEPLFGRDLADPAAIAMKQLAAASRFGVASKLGDLAELPTLVVSGTHDRLALPAFGRALAAAIPGGRYVERDAAHGLPITHAAETNDLLAAHFRGVPTSR